MMRLDKYLADMGLGTRAEVKKKISGGRVLVDGIVCRRPEQKVQPGENEVSVDGRAVAYQAYYYYMLNKPAGVVTAREDGRERTVMDVLQEGGLECPAFGALSPVGRLDRDTEGLLLITNDGALAHALLSPARHVPKTYYALVDGEMDAEDVVRFREGIAFSDFTAMPAELNIRRAEGGQSEVLVTIREGKYHQVKRMVHAVGKEVRFLKRVAMGSLRLDEALAPGEWRELTAQEAEGLAAQKMEGENADREKSGDL